MRNEFLRRFVLWFISGFALALGVLVATAAMQVFRPFSKEPESVGRNDGKLKVTNIDPLRITTVAGALVTITNTETGRALRPTEVELVLQHEGKVLFRCGHYVSREIAAGQQIVEQMLCDKVAASLLPQGTEYVVNIGSAERWK